MANTFIDKLKGGVKSVVCAGAAGGGWVAELLAGSGLPTENLADTIRNFEVRRCNKNPSSLTGSVGDPPNFTGGQCEGVQYQLRVNIGFNNSRFGDGSTFQDYTVTGKIQSVRVYLDDRTPPAGTGAIVPGISTEVIHSGGVIDAKYAIRASSGTLTIRDWSTNPPTRVDGQPDDCGDPPTQVGPKEKHDEPVTVDYEDDDGNPVTLPDLPVRFYKPCISLFPPEISIPFQVETPWGTPVCGRVGIGGDLTDPTDIFVKIDECPSQKQAIENTPQEIEASDKFIIDPPNSPQIVIPPAELRASHTAPRPSENDPLILGVLIEAGVDDINTIPQTTVSAGERATYPDLVFPRIGYVRFAVPIVSEDEYRWSYTEKIDINQPESFIGCPFPNGAATVEVSAEPGWTISYRTVRGKSCCDKCDSSDPREPLPNDDRCKN